MMTTTPGALIEPTAARLAGPRPAPVLIQVPALVPDRPRAHVRPARLRPRPEPTTAGRRGRRRLRREVRVAGSAALFGVPMAWMLLGVWGPRTSADPGLAPASPAALVAAAPSAPEAARPLPAPTPARPWASLSLEPVPTGLPARLEGPVVQPAGYLLPDPGAEESGHAGG